MGRCMLADAPDHFGGVAAAARRQGRAEQLEKPVSSRAERRGAGKPYNRSTGKSADGERASEGPIVVMKRSNVRGAKRPCWSVTLFDSGEAGAR
jgi:hypothetical protein